MSMDVDNDITTVNRADPAIGAVAITTADQTFGDNRPRGVYVATAGDLAVDMANGNTVTFMGLLAGVVYPFAIIKIYDTGTSITGHVLL